MPATLTCLALKKFNQGIYVPESKNIDLCFFTATLDRQCWIWYKNWVKNSYYFQSLWFWILEIETFSMIVLKGCNAERSPCSRRSARILCSRARYSSWSMVWIWQYIFSNILASPWLDDFKNNFEVSEIQNRSIIINLLNHSRFKQFA